MTIKHVVKLILDGADTIALMPAEPPKFFKLYHPPKSDLEALQSDWYKIGGDMKRALERAAHVEK